MKEGIVNSMRLENNEVMVTFGVFRASRNIVDVVRETLIQH